MKGYLLLVFAICMASAEVVKLTDANFDTFIAENPVVMVKFYAEWCGHCKALKPEYEKAAKAIVDQGKPFVLAEVEAPKETKASGRFDIKGFPTLKLFINGEVFDYEGERNAEQIIAFIEKKTSPPSIELNTVDEVNSKLADKGLRCIFVGDSLRELSGYVEVGKDINEYMFYHTSEAIGKKVFPEVAKFPIVVLLKDFDEKKVTYTESLDNNAAFKDFLATNMVPTVGSFNEKSVKLIFQDKAKKGVILCRKAEDAGKYDAAYTALAKAKRGGDYLFMVVDGTNEWDRKILQFFGFDEKNFPVLEVIEQKEDAVRYRFSGSFTQEKMAEFLDNVKAGKVERYIKSEPIPTAEENKGPVYKVVAKTFEEFVLKNDDDILVKYYAPWCGHCKQLAPKYIALAEAMKGNKKLKFAEIDATANDIAGENIHGFPTIKLYPGKSKTTPVTFEDHERSQKTIAAFLKEKCSNPIEVPEIKEEDTAHEQGGH